MAGPLTHRAALITAGDSQWCTHSSVNEIIESFAERHLHTPPMILITGGAGFIGANFVLDWLSVHDEPVVNLDKLTYAGNVHNLASL